jgi:hypothetical protein
MKKFGMTAFALEHIDDFGDEYSVKILKFKNFHVFCLTVFTSVYGASSFLQLNIGLHSLFSSIISIDKLSIEVSILGREY